MMRFRSSAKAACICRSEPPWNLDKSAEISDESFEFRYWDTLSFSAGCLRLPANAGKSVMSSAEKFKGGAASTLRFLGMKYQSRKTDIAIASGNEIHGIVARNAARLRHGGRG